MSKFIEAIKKNREDIIKPVGVLLAICIIIPLALSVTNKVTAKKIAELENENSKKNMQSLVSADDFEKCSDGGIEYYTAIKGGDTAAYIFTESAKGYGGDVSVMTAVKRAFTRSMRGLKRSFLCLKTAQRRKITRLTP